MSLQKLGEGLSLAYKKTAIQIRKASPEILLVTGIAGVIGSTVLACISTLKVQEILQKKRELLAEIREASTSEEYADLGYTKEDANQDITKVYVRTGADLALLYAPAAGLGMLAISAILGSHHILRQRNFGLVAALATVSKGFKEYRDGVKEKYGEEADKVIRHKVRTEKVEETVLDENGKPKKIKKTVAVAGDPSTYSDYARFFTEGCTGWNPDPEYNLTFLKLQERFANETLRIQGYLFLNDVYDALGIPRSREGQVVGWVYRKDNPVGDNAVNFGIYDVDKTDFVQGYEATKILDFNVDGPILDLM